MAKYREASEISFCDPGCAGRYEAWRRRERRKAWLKSRLRRARHWLAMKVRWPRLRAWLRLRGLWRG